MEVKEENKYFFSNFSSIRESKGITIDDIVSKTKLQKEYIIAIENGDFKILPPVYAKLFLKTYSNFLDFDTQNILNLFNEHVTGKYKKRKVVKSNTPQFIENKESFKDKINPNFKNELHDNNYFVEPKKILLLFMLIIIVLASWSSIAYINQYKKESEEKYRNLLLNWEFYKDTSRFSLIDWIVDSFDAQVSQLLRLKRTIDVQHRRATSTTWRAFAADADASCPPNLWMGRSRREEA